MITYKQLAVDAAREAGDLLVELSKQYIKFEMKNAHDILAEADLQSEKIIINKIKANYPNHGILSEEAGKNDMGSEFLWIIDPIDGTINFARHIEQFCISIALSKNGKLILGVIYQPALDKMYIAEKGGGAYLNGNKLAVSQEVNLIDTIIAADLTSKIEKRKPTFDILKVLGEQVRHVRIFGSSAIHLARIAEGQLDLYFKLGFHYWDYAAGILLIEEAGGEVTDFDGKPIKEGSNNILATNKLLHKKALTLMKV